MSRTRMFGALAAVVASAGFVAGCGGGGGYTAAESAPAPAAPAAAAAAAPATPGVESAIGSFAQSDPATSRDQTFAGFQRFPKTRAGTIFVGPAAPAAAATAATSAAVATTANPVTTIPQTPAASATTSVSPTSTVSSQPAPAPVTTQLSASLDVSGKVQTVMVGNQVPASSPQFTVHAITASTVTLKLNSGTLPGGGTTVELTKDNPITLSNPSTGTSLAIKVIEIKVEV